MTKHIITVIHDMWFINHSVVEGSTTAVVR